MNTAVGLIVMVLIVGVATAGVLAQFWPLLILLVWARRVFREVARESAPRQVRPVRPAPVAAPQPVWVLVPVWIPPAPAARPVVDAEVLDADEGWR